MATLYTEVVQISNYWSCRVQAVENSVSVDNNTTNVTFTWQLIFINDSAATMNVDGVYYMTIEDVEHWENIDVDPVYCTYGDTINIFSRTLDITHNEDGTKTLSGINMTAELVGQGNHYVTNQSITLTQINRKSTISSITGGTIGGTMTVNINKPSSSTTTRVYLQVNECDWITVVSSTTATSISFTVPNSMANYMPNEVNAVGRVIIRTYYNGTSIGDHEWDKEFHVPDWMKYSITTVETFADAKINGYDRFVQGKTKLKINTTVNNVDVYGATISEIKFTIEGKTYYNVGTWTDVLYTSGSIPLEVTLTDSRGRAVTYNTTVTVHEYKNPWGSISGYRCDANGNRDDINGTYFKLTYSADRSSIDGANTFAALIESKEAGSETWHEVEQLSDPVSNKEVIAGSVEYPYPLNKQFNIRLTVSDWFTSTEYIVTIQTGLVFLDFRAGGTGLGVSMICTEDDTIQINTCFDIYTANPNYGTHIGADLKFCNVSNESQTIGWSGGQPSVDHLLVLHRFPVNTGDTRLSVMQIDKWNQCYNRFANNYFSNNMFFYTDSVMPSSAYGEIRYDKSKSYFYAQNPVSNHNIGFWNDDAEGILVYSAADQQLLLKPGYAESSDRRYKYDFNEFVNWTDYYNFYMSLKPQTFKYKNDKNEITFIGLVAQDVKESIENNNLSDQNLCLVKYSNDSDGGLYTLAYQELIPLNIKMIQKHENDIQELKDKVAKFKETANKLKKN